MLNERLFSLDNLKAVNCIRPLSIPLDMYVDPMHRSF